MSGGVDQHVETPGKVLHELARQFHRIPRHAVDTRNARIVNAGQQVVQHVTEFVKYGYYILMCQQRLAAHVRR